MLHSILFTYKALPTTNLRNKKHCLLVQKRWYKWLVQHKKEITLQLTLTLSSRVQHQRDPTVLCDITKTHRSAQSSVTLQKHSTVLCDITKTHSSPLWHYKNTADQHSPLRHYKNTQHSPLWHDKNTQQSSVTLQKHTADQHSPLWHYKNTQHIST